MSDITEKIRKLADIKSKIAKLNEEKKALEAWFLERGSEDVADTKFRSVTYSDTNSPASVTYTEARSLAISAPNYLKTSLGKVFGDVFEEKVTVEIKPKNKDIERMLIGVYTGEVITTEPEQIISELPCSDKEREVLAKKLKGVNFETDRNNLMKIGKLDQEDASDFAYLYAEAVVYKNFHKICEMAGISEAALQRDINLAVTVDDTTKITVNGDKGTD